MAKEKKDIVKNESRKKTLYNPVTGDLYINVVNKLGDIKRIVINLLSK